MGPVALWTVLAALVPLRWTRRGAGCGPRLAAAQEEEPVRTDVEVCVKQEQTGRRDPKCGLKWGVFNTARVPEFWVVHELEFFWDDKCTQKFPGGIAKSSLQNRARTMRDNTNKMAWDKNEATWWASECNVILGGCTPMMHYVGILIGAGGTPIMTDPDFPYASLRCVRILQSPNATRFSRSIATAVWANDTETGYEVLEHFDDLSGGYWNRRPAQEAGMWRVWNGDATERPWEVGEIMFYSDVFCTREVFGVPISSSSFGVPQSATEETYCYDLFWGCPSVPGCPCDTWVPTLAFNGERVVGFPLPEPLPGRWTAPCHPFTGCEAMTNWIGLDLGDTPRAVSCIRIFQPTYEGYPRFGYPTHTTRLQLQGWTGFQWLTVDSFTGVGHGNWSDSRPRAGYAWRIVNFDRIPDAWEVFEMALYEEEHCGVVSTFTGEPGVRAGGVSGTPIDVNEVLSFSEQEAQCRRSKGSCSPLAFDQKLYSAWVSSCAPCEQREAWIGVMSRQRAWDIKCFRLYQSPDRMHRTEAVELSRWDGDQWRVERFEGGLGGGTWNYRPSGTLTAWRVIGMSESVEPWTVYGMHMYADDECSGNPVEASTIAVGHDGFYSSDRAMDFDPTGITEWVVSCTPPRPGAAGCARGSAWIGIQSGFEQLQVNCIRMKQHRLKSRQMGSVILEVFNGIAWEQANHVPPLLELGGGSWFTLPGSQASMWRIAARPISGGFGVGFSEVGFYRTPDCSGERIRENFPNVAGIASGHSTSREVVEKTGYSAHLEFMGEMAETAPGFAFDGDYSTFWCDLDMMSASSAAADWQGWLGIDMTSQVTDVMCIKFATAPLLSLQPAWAELQGWDGRLWTTQASVATKPTLVVPLTFPMAQGWQRRPEYRYANWRIENVDVQEGWEVLELKLYDRIDCGESSLLTPHNAFAAARSAFAGEPRGGHFSAFNAFDDNLDTRWRAWCPDGGCTEGQAWVGAGYLLPVQVRCFKIYQSGRHEKQARTLRLSSWMVDRWEAQATYTGLGGNSWNMRPAAPDTLWRMTYTGRAEEDCVTLPKRPMYHRSWGIAEFSMYADDGCSVRLDGVPIASGSWEDTASATRVDDNLFKASTPDMAQDGDEDTFWAANCKATSASPRAKCDIGQEWIGLDVGQRNGGLPVEVRCIRVKQARTLQQACCDPASAVRLDRWNGSAWAEASWRHLDEMSVKQPTLIQGDWINLGQCPSLADKLSGKLDRATPGIWETRARRQSDSCEIPLSGAVKLLTNKLCAKHPTCVEAGYGSTLFGCCPLDGSGVVSKCCCDIPRWKIFEDQWDLGIDRKPIEPFPIIGLEYVIIKLINVMPWVGIVLTIIFYLCATVPRPRKRTGCRYRFWNATSGPVHRWLQGYGLFPTLCKLLIQRQPGEKFAATVGKRVFVVLIGFFLGGSSLWILFALFLAQVVSRVMMLISHMIRVCRSPYSPTEPSERKRLMLFLALPVNTDTAAQALKLPDLAKVLAGFVVAAAETAVFLVRAIADIILLRFAFMNLGAVDVAVSVPDILYKMPTLDLNLGFVTDKVYWLLSQVGILFTETFTSVFEGVPRCEGPVLVFSGMWLVAITLVLVRFLNYDYFGLLLSVKQTATKTRPLFQKSVAVTACLIFQSTIFMFLQMVMLMFSRALSLLFGIKMTLTEASEGWNCPYEGETMSIVVGRVFLIISGVLAIAVTFLSANGHLMGRKQIVGDFGRKCGLNLDGLHDTLGEDAEKGPRLLRRGCYLSMLPTSLGIWFDWWNVEGFLIEHRARVYADQLGFPEECPHCGTTHVPYPDIMKATAMQISLAWQLFPFIGPIIGKLAEHCNNPPVFYRGTRLKCFWASPNLAMARELKERKSSCAFKLKHCLALAVATIKDYGLPLLTRVAVVGIYVTIVYCTHAIDKQNIEQLGVQMFKVLFVLTAMAGYLDAFLPLIVLLIFGAAVAFVGKKAVKEENRKKFKSTAANLAAKVDEKPTMWPLIGQVFHGVSLGGSCSIYFWRAWQGDGLSVDYVQLLGATIGLASGMLVLGVAFAAELLGSGRMAVNAFYWLYSAGISLWVSFWVAEGESLAIQCVLAVLVGVILLYISGMAFRPPVVDPITLEEAPSGTRPILTTIRAVSGPFGIYVGVFTIIMPYDFLVAKFGLHLGTLLLLFAGYFAGLIYAFATHTLCERKPGQRAVIVGTAVTVLVGVLFHWAVGAFLGSVAGTLVGMWTERQMMEEVNKMSLEPPRYTKSKVMSAPVMARVDDPDKWKTTDEPYGSAQYEEREALPSLPSVVRAETPTRATVEAPAALDDAASPAPEASRELQLVGAQEAAGGSSPSREPAAAYGRARRPKKYALTESSKLVVAQGTPGYTVGQSKWEGPPREQVDYSAHLFSLPTSPAATSGPVSPSQTAHTAADERWTDQDTPSASPASRTARSGAAEALAAQMRRQRMQNVATSQEYRAPVQKKKGQDNLTQSGLNVADSAAFAAGRQGANELSAPRRQNAPKEDANTVIDLSALDYFQ